jgi:CCR4-NOT transcription complex subunit 9
VSTVLTNMIAALVEVPSVRLLKHIVRCYLRLSDNLRAREALRQCLPDALQDNTFASVLKDDVSVKRWLSQLLMNISESSGTAALK